MIVKSKFLLSVFLVAAYVAPAYAQKHEPGIHFVDSLAGYLLGQRAPELQSVLGVNDQDWPVFLTKIEKAMDARGALGAQRDFSIGPPPPLPPGTKVINWRDLPFPLTPLEIAEHELMDALADPNTPTDAIKSKLDTYRSIRQKLLADVHIAEEDLKSICTSREEAILVTYGILPD